MAAPESDDPLVAVLYTSTATNPFDDAALADLLAHSRAANGSRDITGMLLYRNGRFIQIVEGPQSRIRHLLDAIRDDDRHGDIRIMMEDRGHPRRFPEWTMGYQPWEGQTAGMPDGFRATFDDVDADTDDRTLRAVRELSRWFRHRTDAAAR